MHQDAIGSLKQTLTMVPERHMDVARIGYAYGIARQPAEARAILAQLSDWPRTQYVPAYGFAIVHLGLGDKDPALEWLEKGSPRVSSSASEAIRRTVAWRSRATRE
jgi:hypothetical protein